jgi:hypothetical protein
VNRVLGSARNASRREGELQESRLDTLGGDTGEVDKMMNYRPQMPSQMPAQNRIIKRQISAMERQFAVDAYKMFQKSLIGLAVFAIVLFVLNTFILPASGAPEPVSIVFQIIAIVLGLVAVGMSINLLVTRKKVIEVLREGMAIEVQGPAYRNRTARNVESWTVGPISMMSNRGFSGMIIEGAPTSVLCIPKLKVAISINNIGLKQGARLTFPPNLEMMAMPAGQIPQPIQPARPVFAQYYPQNQQPQYQQPQYDPKMPYK